MRLFAGTPFDIPPTCERCGKLESDCQCPPQTAPSVPPEKQTARLTLEKRKRGKMVTVVRDLVDDPSLVELLAKLKAACGAGGTAKDGVLEIQGDHLLRVKALLLGAGYRVRD
jgi:translation initiation factor 1